MRTTEELEKYLRVISYDLSHLTGLVSGLLKRLETMKDKPRRTITIDLEIECEPLLSRKCSRCGSTEFREIVSRRSEDPVQETCDYNSQTTYPMSICLGCNRIGMLQ